MIHTRNSSIFSLVLNVSFFYLYEGGLPRSIARIKAGPSLKIKISTSIVSHFTFKKKSWYAQCECIGIAHYYALSLALLQN